MMRTGDFVRRYPKDFEHPITAVTVRRLVAVPHLQKHDPAYFKYFLSSPLSGQLSPAIEHYQLPM